MNTTDLIEFNDDPALAARIRNDARDNKGKPLLQRLNGERVMRTAREAMERHWHETPAARESMTMKQFLEYVDSPIV